MIAALCERYHWAPDFWHRMGWRQLQAWISTTQKLAREAAEGGTTGPESWQGRERDPWWDEQHAKARGR